MKNDTIRYEGRIPAFSDPLETASRQAIARPSELDVVTLYPDCRSFSIGSRTFKISHEASVVGQHVLVEWSVWEIVHDEPELGARIDNLRLNYDSSRTPAIKARMGLRVRTGSAEEDPRYVAAQVLRELL